MRLPNGYTEVQYIQGTGNQYINTEFKPNQNTRLIADFEVLSWPSSQFLGARTSASNTAFNILVTNATSGRDGWNTSAINFTSGNARWKIDKNKNVTTINSSVTTHAAGTFTCPVPIYLFAVNNNGSLMATGCAGAKCYSCQIYDDGSLIRNYVPCINPDGEAGLYDTINSKFYGNAGTGVFFAGPPRVTLPSTYTQLEYILSSATQLIDTEIKPGNTTKVEIDFEPTTLTSNHLMILGARNTSSGGNQFIIGWTGHKSPAVWRSDYGSSQVSFTTTITGATRHYAVKDGASCKIDTETVSNKAATFTSAYTLYLFGGNQAGTAVSQITAKLYRCKIYTSDQLVRDFIPCMNAAGTIGLYDLANNKFYANAGTGVFAAGPEVTWPSNDAIYVKVNGIWKQIDGIKLL